MNKNLKLTLIAWPVLTVTVCAVCFLTGFIAEKLGVSLPPQASLDHILNSHGWRFAVNVAIITVFAPVIEEFLFRWLFYRLPARWIKHNIVMFVSALLFAAAHYIQMPFPDNAGVALFLFGLFQCLLYRRTNALWCCILLHALFNATNFAFLFLFPELAKAS